MLNRILILTGIICTSIVSGCNNGNNNHQINPTNNSSAISKLESSVGIRESPPVLFVGEGAQYDGANGVLDACTFSISPGMCSSMQFNQPDKDKMTQSIRALVKLWVWLDSKKTKGTWDIYAGTGRGNLVELRDADNKGKYTIVGVDDIFADAAAISSMFYDSYRNVIIIGSNDGFLKEYNISTHELKLITKTSVANNGITSITSSPGHYFIGTNKGYIWSCTKGNYMNGNYDPCPNVFSTSDWRRVNSVVYDDNHDVLYAATGDDKASIANILSCKNADKFSDALDCKQAGPFANFKSGNYPISMELDVKDDHLFVGANYGNVYEYSLGAEGLLIGENLLTNAFGSGVFALKLDKHSNILYAGSKASDNNGGAVRLIHLDNGEVEKLLDLKKFGVYSFELQYPSEIPEPEPEPLPPHYDEALALQSLHTVDPFGGEVEDCPSGLTNSGKRVLTPQECPVSKVELKNDSATEIKDAKICMTGASIAYFGFVDGYRSNSNGLYKNIGTSNIDNCITKNIPAHSVLTLYIAMKVIKDIFPSHVTFKLSLSDSEWSAKEFNNINVVNPYTYKPDGGYPTDSTKNATVTRSNVQVDLMSGIIKYKLHGPKEATATVTDIELDQSTNDEQNFEAIHYKEAKDIYDKYGLEECTTSENPDKGQIHTLVNRQEMLTANPGSNQCGVLYAYTAKLNMAHIAMKKIFADANVKFRLEIRYNVLYLLVEDRLELSKNIGYSADMREIWRSINDNVTQKYAVKEGFAYVNLDQDRTTTVPRFQEDENWVYHSPTISGDLHRIYFVTNPKPDSKGTLISTVRSYDGVNTQVLFSVAGTISSLVVTSNNIVFTGEFTIPKSEKSGVEQELKNLATYNLETKKISSVGLTANTMYYSYIIKNSLNDGHVVIVKKQINKDDGYLVNISESQVSTKNTLFDCDVNSHKCIGKLDPALGQNIDMSVVGLAMTEDKACYLLRINGSDARLSCGNKSFTWKKIRSLDFPNENKLLYDNRTHMLYVSIKRSTVGFEVKDNSLMFKSASELPVSTQYFLQDLALFESDIYLGVACNSKYCDPAKQFKISAISTAEPIITDLKVFEVGYVDQLDVIPFYILDFKPVVE